MGIYDPSRALPTSRPVIEWAAARLRDNTSLRALLAASSDEEAKRKIMAHRRDVDDSLPDRFIVVRELIQAGGRMETLSGFSAVPWQMVSECTRAMQQTSGGIDQWHEEVQRAVRKALVGETPDLPEGGPLQPVRRTGMPSAPLYAEETDTYYAISRYALTVAPSSVQTLT